MSKRCGHEPEFSPGDPCTAPTVSACCATATASAGAVACPLTHFQNMIMNCLEHAKEQKAAGRKIVGIMCEYTPRELIMAAGAVPVCLCGGSAATIPDAEEDLPANLCPLIKSTYGYHVQRSNPFLEMADLIVAETTCDGKKKMFELMGDTRPMHVLELPQKQDDPDGMTRWEGEVRKLKAVLEKRLHAEITDASLRNAIVSMNIERGLRRELAALMRRTPPPLTGRQLLDFKSSISCMPADLAQYEKALGMMRNSEGNPDLRDRVRVLLTGVPMAHGAERVLEIIEQHGGLVVCMENCTGVKPILDDVDEEAEDPVRDIAEKYYHLPCSVMTRNTARIDLLRQLAGEYQVDCIVELVWQACLTYDVESYYVKRLAEQELGIPYLFVSTDYSPSDSARIAVRVEALLETVRAAHT